MTKFFLHFFFKKAKDWFPPVVGPVNSTLYIQILHCPLVNNTITVAQLWRQRIRSVQHPLQSPAWEQNLQSAERETCLTCCSGSHRRWQKTEAEEGGREERRVISHFRIRDRCVQKHSSQQKTPTSPRGWNLPRICFKAPWRISGYSAGHFRHLPSLQLKGQRKRQHCVSERCCVSLQA